MNIPQSVVRAVQDKDIPTSQKMLAFMMFMPSIKAEDPYEAAYARNVELGAQVQRLIDENKIRLGPFDENFNLTVTYHDV